MGNFRLNLGIARHALACEFEIVAEGENRRNLIDIANFALDEVERLDAELSCFRPTSEVSFLNDGQRAGQ